MGKFAYIARLDSLEIIRGTIEADSETEAVNRLSKDGYFPISMKSQSVAIPEKTLFNFLQIRRQEVVNFTRQLSILLGSGVSIVPSLQLIESQTSNVYMAGIISKIKDEIKEGRTFSSALSMYPKVFSSLYIALVHAGEISGNLTATLKRLSDFLQKEDEVKNDVWAALAYPLFISAVGILTMIILIGFVVPRMVGMFNDMGQTLPLATMILINGSHFFGKFWWLMAGLTAAILFSLKRYYQSPEGRTYIDRLQLKTIIVRDIVLKTEISRLMRTWALLLSSGINTVSALDVTLSVINNQIIKNEVAGFKVRIIKGGCLSQCLKDSRLFPSFVTNIVAVGEEAGSLENSFINIADEYERDSDRILKILTRLLEPSIILIMGIVVGFIVLAMLLPIFQMNLMVR